MKVISFVLSLLFVSAPAFSCPTDHNACAMMKIARQKLDVVEANIENINTTRTPEGGPYKRQWLSYRGMKCSLKTSTAAPAMKYEPDHPDANDDGYVAYPNMDLNREMKDTLSFSRDYEFAEKVCVQSLAGKNQ